MGEQLSFFDLLCRVSGLIRQNIVCDDFRISIAAEGDYIICRLIEERESKKDFYGIHKGIVMLEKSAFDVDFDKALLEFRKRIDQVLFEKRAEIGKKKMLAQLAKLKREAIVKEFLKSIGASSVSITSNKYGLTCDFVKAIEHSFVEKVVGVEQVLRYTKRRQIWLYIKPRWEVTLDLLVNDFNLLCQQAGSMHEKKGTKFFHF